MKKIAYKNPKGLSWLLVMCVLMFIGMDKAKASHFAAADLFLTYVGDGVDGCTGTTEYKYLVTFDIYKACEQGSAGLPQNVSISYQSTNSGDPVGFLAMSTPRIDTLDGLCDNFKKDNSCRVPANQNLPGFVRHRFEDTLILPSAQTDWRFWWSSGARNGGIVNLQNPQGNIYIEAGLNNLTKYNNSTPRFVISPLPYICVNQPTTYLNGPYDPNGDSLNIVNQAPFSNATTTYNYVAPDYSVTDPVASTAGNPYRVNPLTGTATFTGTKQGAHVLAFRCDEYERGTGIPLGYIMRDVQISILQCAAPPPPLDSLPVTISGGSIVEAGNQGNAVFVCPGSPLNFDMTTASQNASSNVFMEANTNTIPGSQFNTVGGGTSSVTGTFSWTPSQADIGEHTLIITSKDSTCTGSGFSIVLNNYTVLLIKVVEGLDAGPDLPICQLNPIEKQLFVKGADFIDVSWSDISGGPAQALSNSNIHNPIADPKGDATYVVYTPDLRGTCKIRDTVSVFIDTANVVDALPQNPVIQCRPDYVQLEAVIKGKPPVNNVTCGTNRPTSCDVSDSVLIYGSTVYGQVGYDTSGATSPVMNNNRYTKKVQYLLRRDELYESGLRSATINQLGFECLNGSLPTYRYGNFKISIKCTDKDVLKATDGFETGLVEVYRSDFELLDNSWHDYQLRRPYTWDTTKNLIIEICYSDNDIIVTNCGPVSGMPPILRYAPTTYVSGLSLTPDNTNDKFFCDVQSSADIEEVAGRPVFRFGYCEADPLPFTINWSPGKYLSDSTIEQPLAYVPTSADYVVETFGRNGCIIRDTVSIYVPKHDFDIFPKDSSICFGDKTPMYVTNGFSYKWYEYDAANDSYLPANSLNCDDCGYVIASPKETTTYRVSVSDSVWCYDTVEVTLNVKDLPEVRILNSDTTIKYGQSIKLLATGARMYNWSPVSSLTNPNISYPIATPTEATRYIVGGLAANGCRSYDTLYVSMDYRDNLFVPSAFSPNGDGKNDVFRVANVTFQRIVEFRVFNRWGQEIFSGAGNNVSWDGTWKGVEQDMGNYSYIIRVASPDGEVETYKGEVTLIR